jgi:hypothetical protein
MKVVLSQVALIPLGNQFRPVRELLCQRLVEEGIAEVSKSDSSGGSTALIKLNQVVLTMWVLGGDTEAMRDRRGTMSCATRVMPSPEGCGIRATVAAGD